MILEKYYICSHCAELTTQTELHNDIETGGSIGMCYCKFSKQIWRDDIEEFDCETDRIFVEYTEISKKWYYFLQGVRNDIERLDMFKQIPVNKRK